MSGELALIIAGLCGAWLCLLIVQFRTTRELKSVREELKNLDNDITKERHERYRLDGEAWELRCYLGVEYSKPAPARLVKKEACDGAG
jgi:hypothetical protein